MCAEKRIDQFLEQARKGSKRWNQWIANYPDGPADFSGVDFRADDNRDINFAEFVFPRGACFADATFGGVPNGQVPKEIDDDYTKIRPKGGACFVGAKFGGPAIFGGATFGDNALFRRAAFDNEADFNDAVFGEGASFRRATFSNDARFRCRSIGAYADFFGITVSGYADFYATRFGPRCTFRQARFSADVSFTSTTFLGHTDFAHSRLRGDLLEVDRCHFYGDVDFSNSEVRDINSSDAVYYSSFDLSGTRKENRPDSGVFEILDFSGAEFRQTADFSGRSFQDSADFSGARFDQPPDFRDTQNHDQFDWTETGFRFFGQLKLSRWILKIPYWSCDPALVTRIRRLRKIAEEIHAQDSERDLFILQRKAERGVLWAIWWRGGKEKIWRTPISWYGGALRPLWLTILMALYQGLSNCGRSAILPLIWIGALIVGFRYFVYPPHVTETSESAALWSFTAANTFPFFGMSRQAYATTTHTLFNGDLPHVVYQWTIVQSVIGTILLFLAALALRNHFKVQ